MSQWLIPINENYEPYKLKQLEASAYKPAKAGPNKYRKPETF